MEKSEVAAERLNVVVREVAVRPARADERRRWDALMAEHHYLDQRLGERSHRPLPRRDYHAAPGHQGPRIVRGA